MEELNETSEALVNKLLLVKDEFIRLADEAKVSVRRDVVAVELKDILKNTNDYDSLKSAIDMYIHKLYNEKELNDGK